MNNRIKLAACSIAAMATGVVLAQQAPVSDTVVNPLANNPTAALEGQRIFDGTCQTCHGAAGVGDPGRGGPALNTTGLKHGDGDADPDLGGGVLEGDEHALDALAATGAGEGDRHGGDDGDEARHRGDRSDRSEERRRDTGEAVTRLTASPRRRRHAASR